MLQLEYRPLHWAAQRFLIGNVKRHDIGAIAESIKRYGFRDPLCHDANLNNGQGGIIEGNGRLETLVRLHEENPTTPPAGVKLEGDAWLIPILFGCDAENEREAIAYSLDHNLTMLRGGDRTVYEILSQDFEPDVYDLLKDQFDNGSPLTALDGDDLDHALAILEQVDQQVLEFDPFPEEDESQSQDGRVAKFPLALALDKETWEDWNSFKASIGVQSDLLAFKRLLSTTND